MHNIPSVVRDKIGRDLHKTHNHPLEITKRHVYEYFDALGRDFKKFEDLDRIVSVQDNFDRLLIPTDHPARRSSDTFYLSDVTVLRTHTTAHQYNILSTGQSDFLITGDVYRRDSVDKTHYPIFHQMEGVTAARTKDALNELETVMKGLANHLFPGKTFRISPDRFPFTDPSIEVEVKFGDDWLEILGGGIVHTQIRKNLGIDDCLLAWGIGLERLAMILFEIPDIRLFWTSDSKFIDQYSDGRIKKFVPYSAIDPIERDISFWLPDERVTRNDLGNFEWIDENGFCEFVREAGGELVESVVLYDKFYHPNHRTHSHTFHVKFSPVVSWHDGGYLARKANEAMTMLRERTAEKFNVILR